jgi:predicted enzyme related to lactoylglutathione lyase
MAVRSLLEIVVDCRDPATLAGFWGAVFGTPAQVRDPSWAWIESPATRTRIAFQRVPEAKVVKNRVHLDVEVDDIPAERDRLLGLGAEAVGEEVEDELGPFQVMLDPEGNEFCLVR